ncbi:putative mhyt domain signaling protein [Golovinomyces cichoracearum]|uniref:Putative mhyt domain signaling protein n=1 Tax=Golovinomyces cichoracearum TaxID=62708 RepID=A0A420IQI7_9PEZI|nr:putative mhyt domain signaling protein [Golovinomyces cichoracearum]
MSYPENLEGSIVPRTFKSGYVVLSYCISYIGSWTTLELISRRTSMHGISNWLILAAASVSMGGIATWCMHYIGNQAIVLANGKSDAQIKYSLGFTMLSFFITILMSFIAFVTVGSDVSSLIRVFLGGILNSFGILGMHYLGQAGISNYECSYEVYWIISAVILSFIACVTGLSKFFLFRLSWKSSWWKRATCAAIISAGISAIHWLSSIGTLYRLQEASLKPRDRYFQVFTIVVISVLSTLACLILLGLGIIAQRNKNKSIKTAQQLVLAIAKFNYEGKILSLNDEFNISHPIFLWMYEQSRNWGTIADLIPTMRSHIKHLDRKRCRGLKSNMLMNDEGMPIKDYPQVFEELFCTTCASISTELGQPLENMGILFDEIINTEQIEKERRRIEGFEANISSSNVDLENQASALCDSGKGKIVFLVNQVKRREADQLQSAGYLFANTKYVTPVLAASLQINRQTLSVLINMMKKYISDDYMPEPGLYFSIFALRASIDASQKGFEILVYRDAKIQLPSKKINVWKIQDWHFEYLKNMRNKSMKECIDYLHQVNLSESHSQLSSGFTKCLVNSLEALQDEMNDPIFNDAQTTAEPIEVPFRREKTNLERGKTVQIVFKIFLPIHKTTKEKRLVFVPLNFFKTAQNTYDYHTDSLISSKRAENNLLPASDLGLKSCQNASNPETFEMSGKKYKRKVKVQDPEENDVTSENLIRSSDPSIAHRCLKHGESIGKQSFVDELLRATIKMREMEIKSTNKSMIGVFLNH